MRYLYLALFIGAIIALDAGLDCIFSVGEGSFPTYVKLGVLYVLALLLLCAFVTFIAPLSVGHYVRLYWIKRRTAAIGFVAMFAALSLAVLLFYVVLAMAGYLSWSADGWQRIGPRFATIFAVGMTTGCLVAISEEIMFRGFALSYLISNRRGMTTVAAILMSSLVFALAHDLAEPWNWFTPDEFPLFIGLTLLGILLAVVYVVSGSVWCSIGVHAALLVSGRVFPRGRVIEIDYGSWWLGGTGDLREAPAVWLLFVMFTIVALIMRRSLRSWFAVEAFVGMPDNQTEPIPRDYQEDAVRS